MTIESGNCESLDSQVIVRDVLLQESAALVRLAEKIGPAIEDLVQALERCQGRLIVTGMGKMGQIARKATATFCSTGSPAVFLHPSDAVHGDLGIVTDKDVLLALSNSGETEEVIQLLPYMSRVGVPVVAVTGSDTNSLARHATHHLSMDIEFEADPIALAPTTSTTVALAVCDAFAIALMKRRGFTKEQFAIFHPGGNLGRKLLLTVADLMHVQQRVPAIAPEQTLREVIPLMSAKGLGAGVVVDADRKLLGVFTDGDLRRTLALNENPLQDKVSAYMTDQPATIRPESLAAEAMRLMEDRGITVLPVVDPTGTLQGILHLHDLVRVGLA